MSNLLAAKLVRTLRRPSHITTCQRLTLASNTVPTGTFTMISTSEVAPSVFKLDRISSLQTVRYYSHSYSNS